MAAPRPFAGAAARGTAARVISTAGRGFASIAAVLLYGLVASDSDFAVDVFVSRQEAEAALREVLDDEPAFADLLVVVPLAPSTKPSVAAEIAAAN